MRLLNQQNQNIINEKRVQNFYPKRTELKYDFAN